MKLFYRRTYTRCFGGGGGVGYLNIFFKAIFSNEGVTQLEKAVYFRKKQKNNKLLEL